MRLTARQLVEYAEKLDAGAKRYEDLLEEAWGVIANAGGGDWFKETGQWQEAAARWRDKYHEMIGVNARLH